MINLTLHQYFISFSLSRSLGHKFTSNNNSTSRLNRLCIPVSSSFSIRFFPGGKGKGKELVNYTGKILKEASQGSQAASQATPMTPISSQNPSAPLHTVPTTVPTTKANFDKCQPMGPSIQEQYEKSHPTPVSTTTTTGTPFLDTYNSIHPNSSLVKYTGGVKYTGDVPQPLTVYQPTSLTKPLPLTKPSLQENLKPNDKVKKAIDDVLAPAPHTLPVPIPAPVPTPLLLTSSTPTDSVPPTSPVPSPSLPLDISCESFSESFPIPPAPSLPVVVESQSNKKYTTAITPLTTPKNITDKTLIVELINRKLIVEGAGNPIAIKMQSDSTYKLGGSKHGIKLTPQGYAYVERIKKINEQQQSDKQTLPSELVPDATSEAPNPTNPPTTTNDTTTAQTSTQTTTAPTPPKYMIITPPEGDPELFIETGIHKHLIVTYDSTKNSHVALGYLTGKNNTNFLSEVLFKSFQQKQENKPISNTQQKEQHIHFFDNPQLIKNEAVQRVKWDEEYMLQLPKESRELLNDKMRKLQKQPAKELDTKGVTKEECIQICLEYDKTVANKQTHPLTAEQIKQNEQSKLKNQENEEQNKLKKQKQKELNKLKYSEYHKETEKSDESKD